MTIIGVCGSPRIGGNTEKALTALLERVASEGFETRLITLANKNIRGCKACGQCREKKDGQCYGVKDELNEILAICRNADALILGSPVYFGSATPEIKCLIDRLGYTTRTLPVNPMARKIGGALTVARRIGQNFTLAQLSFFFGIMGMVQVGSSYWNILFGMNKDDVTRDTEGMNTIQNYADNLVWLLRKIQP